MHPCGRFLFMENINAILHLALFIFTPQSNTNENKRQTDPSRTHQ